MEVVSNPNASVVSRLSTETVRKAVKSLLQWVKSKAKHQKAQLLEHDEFIYLIFTLQKIPPKARTNPFKIPLPHPIFLSPSLEICLIIDDRPRSNLTSDSAKKKIQSESIPVSKVLKLSKLRTDYRPFEAKRKLCGSYDLFFADRRIIPFLPKLLGKEFFKKKRIPIPIDLQHKNWREQIHQTCSSTLLYLRTGTCCIMKVGKVSQGSDEIVENVVAAVNGAVEIVPKKWGNVRSLHLKSVDSVALPVYQVVPEMGLKIEGFKKEDDGKKNEKKVRSGSGAEEEEEGKKKKKKVPKKGRIHEVRYMDSNIQELMANMVDDDSDGNGEGEVNEDDELGGEEMQGRKKRKKKTEVVGEDGQANEVDELEGVKTKEKKKKKKKVEKVADDDSKASGADNLGGVQATEKKTIGKKKKSVMDDFLNKSVPVVADGSKAKEIGKKMANKILADELPKKTSKPEQGSEGLENGLPNADGMNDKKKKRIKTEAAEEKEKKTKAKEIKRRRAV